MKIIWRLRLVELIIELHFSQLCRSDFGKKKLFKPTFSSFWDFRIQYILNFPSQLSINMELELTVKVSLMRRCK